MRIALIQQKAGTDKAVNLQKGLRAAEEAARNGAELIAFAELAFEPFYPQYPAGEDKLSLVEPIPGKVKEAFVRLTKKHRVVVIPNLFDRDEKDT